MKRTPMIIGLDPRTLEGIREFFDGKLCIECGEKANRFTLDSKSKSKTGSGKFYCYTCYENIIEPVEVHKSPDPRKLWENYHGCK